MARRKEIDKKKILDAAYKLAVREGVESLTARNIAKAAHCSTQPIYLEFSNMSDLQEQVLAKISDELKNRTLQQHFTGEPLIDLDLSYIYFVKDHVGLFKAMFVNNTFGTDRISQTLMELGKEKFKEQFGKTDFSDERIHNILISNWVSATGLATLQLNQMSNFSEDQIVIVLKSQLEDSMKNDRFHLDKVGK
ncbi:TetR/AcrR family transcriptional regulator [Lactobacillus sp. PV037]|uniref:TetR/AcrR family transcriptional regulator n=1 Tax=unclassified Lactobacillus TaxID=2620435 RepID=UPI00223FC719|nr:MULTISPECIES: TetR/AcrR family transcriptional regulator [unclassified Lactobacillus]QNQ82815.1 TetR/AcrR family transcriptional regulator [Lactobacillus sp. PV012]QNQ83062.1 TetR/AcrR family transcriptional regulator [Lactobacillus sp. PV037]